MAQIKAPTEGEAVRIAQFADENISGLVLEIFYYDTEKGAWWVNLKFPTSIRDNSNVKAWIRPNVLGFWVPTGEFDA